MGSFKQTQQAFMAHLKDPDNNAFEQGIEDRRLHIYRELFFNNILGFLNSGFPVLKSLYSESAWQALARQFFAKHQCRSPYFIDISKEFVEYLSSEHTNTQQDPVFIQELAHYEWLELDVSVRKSKQAASVLSTDIISSIVQMSDVATLVSYQYPVHLIGPDFQPSQPSEIVYLVVYRDVQDEVNFTLVNTVTAHLLNSILQQDGASVASLLDMMILAMPQLAPQQVKDSLTQVIDELLSQQILIAQ
jgi:hypothetical protein